MVDHQCRINMLLWLALNDAEFHVDMYSHVLICIGMCVRQASLHSEMYDLKHKYDSDAHTRTVELDMITAEHDRATQKIQLLSKEVCVLCVCASIVYKCCVCASIVCKYCVQVLCVCGCG
jgi:hypothetical protein